MASQVIRTATASVFTITTTFMSHKVQRLHSRLTRRRQSSWKDLRWVVAKGRRTVITIIKPPPHKTGATCSTPTSCRFHLHITNHINQEVDSNICPNGITHSATERVGCLLRTVEHGQKATPVMKGAILLTEKVIEASRKRVSDPHLPIKINHLLYFFELFCEKSSWRKGFKF